MGMDRKGKRTLSLLEGAYGILERKKKKERNYQEGSNIPDKVKQWCQNPDRTEREKNDSKEEMRRKKCEKRQEGQAQENAAVVQDQMHENSAR